MIIGYLEWHDGIGYDLEALAKLSGEERAQAEDLVISRHACDWRDIEALDYIGSPRSLRELEKALEAKPLEIKIEAADRLAKRGLLSEAQVEAIIEQALPLATLQNGMVRTLRFAEEHPTPAVRRALLSRAQHGHLDIRAHAAALLHFLHGLSASPFDWEFRSFYLRFGSRDRGERHAAYLELCAQLGVDPASGQ
jgi:hypothetical protein